MAVLVVDDQLSIRGLISACLRELGFRIIVPATNGAEALRHLKQRKFDLVISDWIMDDMSGLELVAAIRVNPILAATPFILMSGMLDQKTIELAKQAGVNSYLHKPFDTAQLGSAIESIIGKLT